MSIKIRNLKYGDCLTLVGLIKKLMEKINGARDLVHLISSEVSAAKSEESTDSEGNFKESYVKIGTEVLSMLVEYLQDDLNVWFADLLNVKVEELLEMPFETPLCVIEQLIDSEESGNFFTTAFRLFKKIQGLSGRFRTE